MIATRFTELVGCAVPIQQAGMGAGSPPELVAAVSEAGALGMLGTARPGLTPPRSPIFSSGHACSLISRLESTSSWPRYSSMVQRCDRPLI